MIYSSGLSENYAIGGVTEVRVTGTQKEVDWMIQTLSNGCENCPFFTECNSQAVIEAAERQDGYSELSCCDFLRKKIEIIIESR